MDLLADLKALVAKYDVAVAPGLLTTGEPPLQPGFERVRPTGAKATATDFRDYPTRQSLIGNSVNPWAYAVQLMQVRPDLCSNGTQGMFNPMMGIAALPGIKEALAADHFGEAIDRIERGALWATQAQIDEGSRVAQAQQGAQWLPGQQQPAGGPEPVPDEK